MLLVPDRRPPLPHEVATAQAERDSQEHARLQTLRELEREGAHIPEYFKSELPQPQFPLPTVLLTDQYVHDSMKARFYAEATLTISFAVIFAAGVVSLAESGYERQVAYLLAGAMIAAIATSVPFSKHRKAYKALCEQQKTKKPLNGKI